MKSKKSIETAVEAIGDGKSRLSLPLSVVKMKLNSLHPLQNVKRLPEKRGPV